MNTNVSCSSSSTFCAGGMAHTAVPSTHFYSCARRALFRQEGHVVTWRPALSVQPVGPPRSYLSRSTPSYSTSPRSKDKKRIPRKIRNCSTTGKNKNLRMVRGVSMRSSALRLFPGRCPWCWGGGRTGVLCREPLGFRVMAVLGIKSRFQGSKR